MTDGQLSKSLKSRHVTMISIGGIIGAGLFVGSGAAIAAVGPAIIVSYLLAGAIIFLIMRMLSEMAAANPDTGSFTEYTRLALGDWAGFISGWLYWYFWVVVVAVEAIAGAAIIGQWLHWPLWQIQLALMVMLTFVNLMSTRSYGEFEFWFASIKVAAIVVFILLAAAAVFGLKPTPGAGFGNLIAHGGFVPNGPMTVLAGIATVIFALCGAEIATIAAAESQESSRAIARLTITIVLRIILFYVLSITLIVAVVPWTQIIPGLSPFAAALDRMNIPAAGTAMNLVVLVSVLSCLNSGVYVDLPGTVSTRCTGRCAPIAGKAQPAAGTCARHPRRKLVRVSGRHRLGDLPDGALCVPGQCFRGTHARRLCSARAGPDQHASAARA